jgi:hypothetical protein
MADFPGLLVDPNLQASPDSQVGSILNAVPLGLDFPLSAASDPDAGSDDDEIPSATASHDNAGQTVQLFGGNLFERIIVIPRNIAVGFILSSTQFPVEVWNTFHDASKDLTAITISGPGGITIANPFTLPKAIGPKGSIIFQALLPGSGDVNIALDVVFAFSGIAGTDMEVTGSRILVFSVQPNWDPGIEEKLSDLTDVLIAYDDSEQRRALRRFTRRGLKFTALTLNARDAAGMESLIWGWQHQPYGVPFWPDAQPLLADVAAGSIVVEVNTVDRLFAMGGIFMLWSDEFTFEALTILDMDSGSITASAPLQFNWKAGVGTFVVPLFLGRCSNTVKVTRLWSGGDQIDIEFQGEAQQIAPAPTQALTQFKGFDVLEVAPNWESELERVYNRSTITMDPGTGPITVDDKGGTPVVQHDLPWWISPHAAVTALRAFLLARRGQFSPFWTPTFDQDLVLAETASAGTAVLNIKSVDYTRFFFPDQARRYLALISRGGAPNQYVSVTNAVDNGDGTESLTLSAVLLADVPADSVMISFLAFSRLSSDDNSILWNSTDFAQAAVGIQELPRELPS